MGRVFGTDGIRGVANHYPMTPQNGFKLGRAIVKFTGKAKPEVIVGRDTRLSGPMLEYALGAGLMGEGANLWAAGIIPTPGVAYLTRELGADVGVVISASHNPFDHNGFKVFSPHATKLTEDEELELEDIMFSLDEDTSGQDVGRFKEIENATERYVEFLRGRFEELKELKGLKVVLDCANGATYKAAPMLFGQLGTTVISIGTEPNGANINEGCGSQCPEELAAKVVESQASVGLAFDGDGDRLVAVDEKGRVLTGDQLLAIFAKVLKEKGKLHKNVVVSTVMSNIGLKVALQRMGLNHVVTSVGDRNVYQEMIRRGAVLGGEESGHIIFLQHHSTGDGMLSALQLVAAMEYLDRPLSELAQLMEVFPQVLLNVSVTRKPLLSEIPEVSEVIKKVENELGRNGRVLVRYSGTESVCRVMVEGDEEDKIKNYAEEIAAAIVKSIGE